MSFSTLLKAFLIRNAFLVQTQLLCPQVPQLKTWGQRKQEEHEAGEVEIDCPTQLAILYSFDDTLIVSEQVKKHSRNKRNYFVLKFRTWGQRKQEQHEAGGAEGDCVTA